MLTAKDIDIIRGDFPYLAEDEYSYLDNAATTQKPRQAIEALTAYYARANGNPHRGAHRYAARATEVYEGARNFVATKLGAREDEIVFVRNATEGFNLVAYALEPTFEPGDVILVTKLEHHSNFVPWQALAERTGATLRFVDFDEHYAITKEAVTAKLDSHVKLVAMTAASNVTATMPDIARIIPAIRKHAPEAKIMIDGAQYAPHHELDVKALDCDFYTFSGHKMLSAMGIGVLYGKREHLNAMRPFLYGGEMIEYVYEDHTTFMPAPMRFEAGTMNVGGAASLKAAWEYLDAIGFEEIAAYEAHLMDMAYTAVLDMPFITTYTSPDPRRSPVLAFNIEGVHPHDGASILDAAGVAVRSGHHCAQIFHRAKGINASLRASFAFYNTEDDVAKFIEALKGVRKVMGYGS